jgi:hypothetical protein|tara:strand:+ start:1087 stop:1464 length:378 start_codon:yes stop_codon:yes gene_type:complete
MSFSSFPDVSKIKWGPGVLGRTLTFAVMIEITLLVAFGIAPNETFQLWLLIALLALPATALALAYIFAFKHPGLAVLEGTEAVQYRAQEMEAKDHGAITIAIGSSNPSANTAAPKQLLSKAAEHD